MVSLMVQFYKNYRVFIVYFVMTLIVVAPYLESAFGVTDLRMKILTACPLLIVFLLNDWRTEMIARLAKVEESVNNPDPPTYEKFPKIEDRLSALLSDYVKKGKPVTIDVLGVSAKYSWPFLKGKIQQLAKNPPIGLRLTIRIAVTSPEKLDEWDLGEWAKDGRHCLDKFNDFSKTYCETLSRSGICITMLEYDNLPHWHGVIVNNAVLFQGRTAWFRDGDIDAWRLEVGEVEYREFHLDDHYGGKTRIERFTMWLNRYAARAESKGWVHTCGFAESQMLEGNGDSAVCSASPGKPK